MVTRSTRNLILLGATGSIGRSTLAVLRAHPEAFRLTGIAAYSSVSVLLEICREFSPKRVCLVDPGAAERFQSQVDDSSIEILSGQSGLTELAAAADADIVVNAVVGAAGLRASLATVAAGIPLALANKESLVAGGPLFQEAIAVGKPPILPIDSEHSALWQVLNGERRESIRRILLTASGGPFRQLPTDAFADITVEEALAHPTWQMGPKITVDSATLVNKGLEVIEAVNLFQVPIDAIEIVVHPQSIIHSMIEFVDSSIVAQLSRPTMVLPIRYALFWPDRVPGDDGRIDWNELRSLTFEPPDWERFPALGLAVEVARRGGTAPAIYNAANETAVAAFLERSIGFIEIPRIIERTLEASTLVDHPSLDDILTADATARETARRGMEKVKW